jgi:hypothetical protein
MAIFLLAALHLFFFSNGGPQQSGIGEILIDGGHGTLTGATRSCKSKMRPGQIRRIENLAEKTKPKKWQAAYTSDCLECYGARFELGKKTITFDAEAKLPPDLRALRKEFEEQLDVVNKRCAALRHP